MVCFKTEFLKLLYTWNETPQVCFTGVQRDWDPVKLRFIDGTHQSIKQRIQTWWKYENSNMWQPCEGFFVQDIEHRAAKKLQLLENNQNWCQETYNIYNVEFIVARPSLHLPCLETIPRLSDTLQCWIRTFIFLHGCRRK